MSSTVLKSALACATFAFVFPAASAQASLGTLSCETRQVEGAALKQAPKTVRRVSKHVLEVATIKGPQQFVDKPPHDAREMGGLHWRYCGFDTHAKAYLVGMSGESAYSGELLLEETGQRVRAGHTVLFSPTMTSFLAIEQEPGVDGEHWIVRDRTGKTIWKGYAGTVARVDGVDMVVSTFARPHWTRQGELAASFVCASSKPGGVVTLMRAASGEWSWRGHGKCR